MTVATWTQPNYTTQSNTAYKTNIDGGTSVLHGIAGAFAPHESSAGSPLGPDMTVTLDAGRLLNVSTLIEQSSQTTGTITAPVTTIRSDIVVIDNQTGVVSVITGSESTSPLGEDPAITSGKIPIARINLTTSTTSITNSIIDDLRSINTLIEGATTSDSVSLGRSALDALTSGSNNTAVGTNTLTADTTGSNNVAIGFNTLAVNVSGNQNTAVGVGALDANTTDNNTAIGFQSLSANTNGTNNTGLGWNSLDANTSGSNNTGLGDDALGANTTAGDSTAVGASALASSTGTQNTALGSIAGSSTTTGTNNTMLGYNAQSTTATASNEFTLGNSSVATLRCQQTTITSLSDKRDKKNIGELKLGLKFINDLAPVAFDWNMRDGGKIDIPDTGFIAQDLQDVQNKHGHLPGLVYDVNPEKLEAGYGKLLPVIVKAIQELSAKIEQLESK